MLGEDFLLRVVRHWHWLTMASVDAPSLEVLKARSDAILGNLIWWVAALPIVGELELDNL